MKQFHLEVLKGKKKYPKYVTWSMLRDFRLVWLDLGGMIPESPESLRKLCALFIWKIMHHVYRYFFKASCGSQPKRKICNDKCNTVVVCFTFSYSSFQLAPNFPFLYYVELSEGRDLRAPERSTSTSSVAFSTDWWCWADKFYEVSFCQHYSAGFPLPVFL